MGFSMQEYWSGLPRPPPRHLPQPRHLTLLCCISCLAGTIFTTEPSGKPPYQSWKVKLLSRVRLFATPWTVAYQAPPSMGFSRQECWSGLPFSSPGDLPDPGIEPGSPALQADALPSEPLGKPSHTFLHLCPLSCKHYCPRFLLGLQLPWLSNTHGTYTIQSLSSHAYLFDPYHQLAYNGCHLFLQILWKQRLWCAKNIMPRTSLVVQWIRTRLPMQGT